MMHTTELTPDSQTSILDHLTQPVFTTPDSTAKTMNTAVSSQALSSTSVPSNSTRASRSMAHPLAHKCIPDESPATFVYQELSQPWPWLQPATYTRVLAKLNTKVRSLVAFVGLM